VERIDARNYRKQFIDKSSKIIRINAYFRAILNYIFFPDVKTSGKNLIWHKDDPPKKEKPLHFPNCEIFQQKFLGMPEHERCEEDEEIYTFYWENEKLILLIDEKNQNFNIFDFRNGDHHEEYFENFDQTLEKLLSIL